MPRPKKDSSTLNVKLASEVNDLLEKYCSETGATKTKTVELAVKKFVEEYFAKVK